MPRRQLQGALAGVANGVRVVAPVLGGVAVGMLLVLQLQELRQRRKRRRSPRSALAQRTEGEQGGARPGAQDADGAKGAAAAGTDELLVTAVATGAAPLPPPLEHVLLDETLPLDVKALWRLMMADAEFWREFMERRQARGLAMTGWVMVDAESKRGGFERRLEYTVPVKRNRLGPSEARCEEVQHCRRRGADGFWVSVVARTPEVPCGGAFHQELQWVAAPTGAGRARLMVSARVVFTRPLFGMRGLIESSSLEGMRDAYRLLSQVLRQRLAALPALPAGAAAEPAPALGGAAAGVAPGALGRRDALLTQLSRRAPAWRALFLSALFAAVGAWALLAAAAWAPAGTGLAGAPLAWGSWAPPQSVGMAAPAWLAQLRAALLRASL